MNPGEFMMAMARLLAVDVKIANWCQQNFGKPLTVQVGVDEDNPPEPDAYPICVLVDCRQVRGHTANPTLQLELGLGVVNEEIVTADGVTSYSGLLQVNDLKQMVEEAIYLGRYGTIETVGEFVPVSLHPLHVINLSIRCEMTKSSRRAVR